MRYPITPNETEIRPPTTTPPLTPVASQNATLPAFGSYEPAELEQSRESFWMSGVPPPPPLPDFASASAQAGRTNTGLNASSASGMPITPPPPPSSAFTQAACFGGAGTSVPGGGSWPTSTAPPPPMPMGSLPGLGSHVTSSMGSALPGPTLSLSAPVASLGSQVLGATVPGVSSSSRVEEPSRYIQSLPKLEEYTADQGAVTLGDWLVTISPVVGSLSSGSAVWFTGVQARVNEHYTRWLASDPVSRLAVRQAAIEDGATWANGQQYAMLEQRMTTLLLEAIPASVKTLLHTRYQPAGQAEKAAILQYLVNPASPRDLNASVKNLRRWIRLLARSAELQLASPDPSLLIKAVDRLGQPYLVDSAAIFRVQAFRLQHGVDHQPSYAIAVSLAQLYLAERQKVAALQEGRPQVPEPPEKPKGPKRRERSERPDQSKDSAKETCRQFNTEKGCPRGNGCKYLHKPTEGGMSGRCFNCGGAHLKAECTSPGGGAAEKPQEKPPLSAARQKARKAQGQVLNTPPSTGGEVALQAMAASAAASACEPPALGPTAAQALKDAATSLHQELLKAIRTVGADSNPDDLGTGGKGLIDGGATSCLRSAKSAFEWKEASPTTIRLAVGETEARTSSAGTLLLPPKTPCDPIVALHELVRIGYRMTFLEIGKIRIWKPGRPDLQVDCSSGCPEVPVATALDLIREVERSKILSQEKLCRLASSKATFTEALEQLPESGEGMVAWFRTLVPSIPERLLPELAVPSSKKAGPFNRRKRRTLLRAKDIVVHLCPGSSRGMFDDVARQQSWEVIEVDVEEDLHDPSVFGFLLLLAAKGAVRALVGGPPCSRARGCTGILGSAQLDSRSTGLH